MKTSSLVIICISVLLVTITFNIAIIKCSHNSYNLELEKNKQLVEYRSKLTLDNRILFCNKLFDLIKISSDTSIKTESHHAYNLTIDSYLKNCVLKYE